jgi:hypothetical protein
MYRYLFEETCFDHSFESLTPLDNNIQSRAKAVLSKALGLKYEEVRLVYYKKAEGVSEAEFEGLVKVDENFEFRATLLISTYDKTIISLKTYLSRIDPVYLRDTGSSESIVKNIFQEFMKNSFYQDIFADYQRKYEEVSKKVYEGLEILFGL